MDCMGLVSPNDFQAFKHFHKWFQEKPPQQPLPGRFRRWGRGGHLPLFSLSSQLDKNKEKGSGLSD